MVTSGAARTVAEIVPELAVQAGLKVLVDSALTLNGLALTQLFLYFY